MCTVKINFRGEADYIPSEEEIKAAIEDAMHQLDITGVADAICEIN